MRTATRTIVLAVLATLCGCMALPFAGFHLHDYEGELAPEPIRAVEDGRRVTFVQLQIERNADSPWNVRGRTVLVEKSTATAGDTYGVPTWTSAHSLSDQTLLRRAFDELPTERDPEAMGRELSRAEGPYAWWAGGYVVSTQPLIVARLAGAGEADAELGAATRPWAMPTPISTALDPSLRASAQQGRFPFAYVEPAALGERVDTLLIRLGQRRVEVIRLTAPMTLDALLDRLARPDALVDLAAEQPR